jgi:RND superfamily putative drug exporter
VTFAGLAGVIDRHAWRILAITLAITAVAAVFGIHVHGHLKPRGFDVAGSGSAKARELIAEASGIDPSNSVLALVRLPDPYGSPSAQRVIGEVETKLRRDPAVVAVVDAATAQSPGMVAADRRSTYLVAALRQLDDKQQEDAGRRLLAAFAGDARVTLGGNPVANHEISTTIERDLRRAELFVVPLIVLLSFFLFRGFVASLLAPLAGGITVLVSFFLLRALTSVTWLSVYALNLVTGLSLGLSIDWSLLLLSRYREERARTDDLRLALRRAIPRAGHTILFSAVTVAASLACLLVFPLRFLRSMGYGGIVASTVAMLTALVVLPTALRLLGRRIDALSLPRWRDPARLAEPPRHWRAVGRLTVQHPVAVTGAVVAAFVLVATPIARVTWTTVDASSLPSSAQAYRADRVINRSSEFARNGGTPFYLAFDPRGVAEPASAARALANSVRRLDGVRAVWPPRRLGGTTWQISVVSADTPYSASTQRLVRKLAAIGPHDRVFVGGDAAAFHDERHAIAARLPSAIGILVAATLIILFLLTGSLAAPALALVMNALTLAATFGVLILIFQDGRFESLLGYTGQGALDLTIPLVLAALVFAICTDYGVFLLSRVREAQLSGREGPEAISGSVAIVGRVVAAAAILFAVSIGAFGTSSVTVLKVLGVGTAVAVLADAVFVRCLLLPATLRLLGPRAWWLPATLGRLHRRIAFEGRAEPELRQQAIAEQ